MDLADSGIALLIGLVAGVVGGLAGIGGSIVMIPALGLVFGYTYASDNQAPEQHLYAAAAMCVNVVVALASSRKHKDEGALDTTVRNRLIPGMLVGIVGGVWLSNQLDGRPLKQLMALFLFGFVAWTLFQTVRGLPERSLDDARTSWKRIGPIGAGTGVLAGLLGIGGGIVMVPLMQVICRMQLRRAIATSAAVMWVSAGLGAAMKVWTLPEHSQSRVAALSIAGAMAVGAVAGAPLGAWMTHRLKLPALRVVISVILALGGGRAAGWW
ncbi:MAG: sulfite exporter TauE/SafE family protein [Planctomycetota bacterium]